MSDIDLNIHKIFVEGSTDQACLEKILELKYGILFPHKGILLEQAIISCNGWVNLINNRALISKVRETYGGKNLVIFDADAKRNEDGYQKRYNQLVDIANQLHVKFEIFLFPDNETDGCLEDFYSSCFKKELRFFDECWNRMIACIESKNIHNVELELPNIGGKIYSYVDLFKKLKTEEYENKKTKRHYFDSGLWEFDFEQNNNLKKLTLFLENSGIIDTEQN